MMAKASAQGPAAPTVYSISPERSFVDALAQGLLDEAGGDMAHLADAVILLPNRRACRSLREAFLRLLGQKPTLLPVMRPIGDVDEEEISFLSAGFGLDLSALPPAIHPVRRLALLMQYVEKTMPVLFRMEGAGDTGLAPAQAWRLAGELARLMDQVETEGKSFESLQKLVPDDLAQHWDITLQMLKIVSETWPEVLKKEGAANPAERRDKLIRMLASTWQAHPPKGRIIAAGSTGSIPATAELLRVVARLPHGMVILPGLDMAMDEEAWEAIDLETASKISASVTHPQASLKALLHHMGVSRHEVEHWGHQEALPHVQRVQYIRHALLPADQTSKWQQMAYHQVPDGVLFAGMQSLVAPTRREEADAIAVLMREVLEVPGQTAALVTPDRQLARHVRASLARWDVEIDDSGGDRALNTVPGRFLGLMATAVSEQFAPVPLLALLQHPFVAAGHKRATFLSALRRLDQDVLRGVRPALGIAGLLAQAREKAADPKRSFSKRDLALIMAAYEALQPFEIAFEQGLSFAKLLEAHITAAEALVATEDMPGADRLWKGEEGNALAERLTELISEASTLGPVKAEGYDAFFAEICADVTVRPVWRRHPRLSIWGPLEARLQRADVMILGGLNEGIWPAEVKPDPWMSRPMRHAFGLPPLERRTGQSGHDFMQAVSAPVVYLTRAEKVDGAPTVPSRWWFRLEALAGRPLPQARHYVEWAEQLTHVARVQPCQPPTPKPPLAARPRKLSVTQVESWMRDPYSLYAAKVLGFKPLDPVDQKPNAAQKGNLLHEALENFLLEDGPRTGEAGFKRLLDVGAWVFNQVEQQPTVYAFWWPRFVRIAEWFTAHEAERGKLFDIVAVEGWAEMPMAGADFTLFAKADRIDQRKEEGGLSIIDYKTGTVPTAKRIAAGFAPQLPLEGLLAERGAFAGVEAAPVEDLLFWKLMGGEPVHEVRKVKDVADQIAGAEEGLLRLIAAFDKPGTPYLSNPRPTITGYGDYDHLARVKEWRSADDPFLDILPVEGDDEA